MGEMYDIARRQFAQKEIDWVNDTVMAQLLDIGAAAGQYLPNYATHDFLDDIPSTAKISTPVALAGKQVMTNGALDALDPVFNSVSSSFPPIQGMLLYKQVLTGGNPDATLSPLIILLDSKFKVTVGKAAIAGETTLWVDPLDMPLANGTVLGLGGTLTATLTAAASAGERSLSVSALAAPIPAGSQAEVRAANSGLPITPANVNIRMFFDNSTDRILRL